MRLVNTKSLKPGTSTDLSSVIAHCAYQHHERLDGSGYPSALIGNEIHLYAKIIAIADVFDAVTSNRIYRDAMLPDQALEILYAGAVHKFDKDLIETFRKSIAIFPNDLSVQLSNGETGVVSRQNQHFCDRPIIRILEDNQQQSVTPYEIDLATTLNVTISSCYVN